MNKCYVEGICLCFYTACSLIVILKNDRQLTLVYYIDRSFVGWLCKLSFIGLRQGLHTVQLVVRCSSILVKHLTPKLKYGQHPYSTGFNPLFPYDKVIMHSLHKCTYTEYFDEI
jgi:hypothetical protein